MREVSVAILLVCYKVLKISLNLLNSFLNVPEIDELGSLTFIYELTSYDFQNYKIYINTFTNPVSQPL